MDIITQRFIAIGNRLIAELRLLRNGIEKLVGAVHDAEEAQNQQRQQEPPVVRAELQIPEAIERERAKPDERHYRVQVWLWVATTPALVAPALSPSHYDPRTRSHRERANPNIGSTVDWC